MGNCPYCGAEMGFGVAVCPNCGSQLAGDSLTDGGQHDSITGDSSGDGIDHGADTITGGQGGVPGPEVPEQEEFAADRVADDVSPNLPIEADSSVPGSEIPRSHGGGFTQQGEDGTAPSDMITSIGLDRPSDEFPDRPEPDLSLDDSGRRVPPRINAGLGIAVIILIVIVALVGWYIWTSNDDGNGNGNGEPNGNGDDPLDALHVDKGMTTGSYPYEPPGEYHISVVLRNNGSKSVDLSDHDISVTVWIDFKNKGQKITEISGTIGSGETRTFDIVVETELLGGDDQLKIGVTLRKNGGQTQVHTISYDQTL